MELVVGEQALLPDAIEDVIGDPLLEAVMGRGATHDAGPVERPPRAAGAQDEEDAFHAPTIRDPRPTAAVGVCAPAFREQRADTGPELIGQPPSGGLSGNADPSP